MKVSHLFLCLLIALISGCQSSSKAQLEMDQKRAKLQYQIGVDALHKNQMPKAFQSLIKSNEIYPNQPEVLDALAYAWRVRGDLVQAEDYYKQALHAGAGATTHTNYGSLLVSQGRYAEAEKELRQALTDPSYNRQFVAFVNLGDALAGLKQYDGAVMNYRKAGLLQPRSSLPALKEARVYKESGRLDYAASLYETLLRSDPADQVVLADYLELLKAQHDSSTARKFLNDFRGQVQDAPQKIWASEQLKSVSKW